jgi:hypothetical protein
MLQMAKTKASIADSRIVRIGMYVCTEKKENKGGPGGKGRWLVTARRVTFYFQSPLNGMRVCSP